MKVAQKKSVTSYKEGKKSGVYLSWYENGNPQVNSENIPSDFKTDMPSSYIINDFWNSENLHTVKNGNGHYNLIDKENSDEGDIKNGLREGMWQGTDSILRFNYIEKYADGKLVSGVSTDFKGGKHIYREVESKPDFPGSMNAFYSYVGRNFMIPEVSSEVRGKIFISFIVDRDGSLTNIKIIRGLSPEMNKEAYRLISECPNWIAGKKRGIPVRVLYTLPINLGGPN